MKPNKQRDADNMGLAMQNILPSLSSFAQNTGDFTAVNALLQDWAKTMDLDISKYLIQPPPPPPPGMMPPEGMPPEGVPPEMMPPQGA